MAVANFEGDSGGGGSDATEVIREEVQEEAALPDPPPPMQNYHDEDVDHYDNIQVLKEISISRLKLLSSGRGAQLCYLLQVRQASSLSSFGNWNNNQQRQ